MGTRRRHTPEQIIRKLREDEKLIGQGSGLAEVCMQLEISEPTWRRWVARYGGMKADDAKRLNELERAPRSVSSGASSLFIADW